MLLGYLMPVELELFVNKDTTSNDNIISSVWCNSYH